MGINLAAVTVLTALNHKFIKILKITGGGNKTPVLVDLLTNQINPANNFLREKETECFFLFAFTVNLFQKPPILILKNKNKKTVKNRLINSGFFHPLLYTVDYSAE